MIALRALAASAVVVCLSAATAFSFVRCKMPNGELVFADVPPPGCVVEGELKNPEPAAGEASTESSSEAAAASSGSGDGQAIAAKRRIERDLEAAAENLADIRRDLANAPKAPPGVYVNTQDGSAKYYDKERVDPRAAVEIQAREQKALERIATLKEEFAALTREVEKQNGGRAPSWWTPPRCDGCP